LVVLFFFTLVFYLKNGEAAISQATKNIINAVSGECTQNKLKVYMQRGSSMDPAIGDILVYAPRINVGYMCLLNNYKGAIDAVLQNGSIGAAADYYAATCTSDSNLNSCIKILQNPTIQSRLGQLVLTIFDPFTPEITNLVSDIINEALDLPPVTKAKVQAYIKRFKNLSASSKESVITEIPSLKQILNKGGSYNKPYQNALATATFIFGTAKPNQKQKTKANNALKKGCDYLHKNFNEYFYFVRDWLAAYPISTAASTNLTAVSSFTASSVILAGAAGAFLKADATQEKVDEIFTNCYSI